MRHDFTAATDPASPAPSRSPASPMFSFFKKKPPNRRRRRRSRARDACAGAPRRHGCADPGRLRAPARHPHPGFRASARGAEAGRADAAPPASDCAVARSRGSVAPGRPRRRLPASRAGRAEGPRRGGASRRAPARRAVGSRRADLSVPSRRSTGAVAPDPVDHAGSPAARAGCGAGRQRRAESPNRAAALGSPGSAAACARPAAA